MCRTLNHDNLNTATEINTEHDSCHQTQFQATNAELNIKIINIAFSNIIFFRC